MTLDRVGEIAMLWLYRLLEIPLWVLLVFAAGIGLVCWARARWQSAHRRADAVVSCRGITGAQAAAEVIAAAELANVRVERAGGRFSDFFDATTGTLRLSPEHYDKATLAAVCVSAGEIGCALQEHRRDAPMPLAIREWIAIATRIGSATAGLLAAAGLILDLPLLLNGALLLFAGVTVLPLACWTIDRDAAHRALRALAMTALIDNDQEPLARELLSANTWKMVARVHLRP